MNAPSADELSARIFDAFAGVRLDGGVSLIEAEYADDYDVAPDHLIALEEKDDWTKIINDRLCEFTVTFCFTDYRGFRFYIAPYMIWALRNFRTSDSIITDFTIYAIETDRYMFADHFFREVFTLEQVRCMHEFLLFACENEDHFDAGVAYTNLIRLQQAFPEIKEAESGRGDGIAPVTPPTPPGMRVRTGRFR
jgi:hypothetical protein